MAKRSELKKAGYRGKGGHERGHPLGPATKETSIGAARQQAGLPYFPAPARGFRPEDAGKEIRDPENRTIGPISDFGSHGG
jgi:hypothetical protein